MDPAVNGGQPRSKQKIPLCERQHFGRLTGQQHAVSAHFVGLRIHFHQRQVVVEHHVALGDGAGVFDRHGAAFQTELFGHAGIQRGLGNEGEACRGDGRA